MYYWEKRSHLGYYQAVKKILEDLSSKNKNLTLCDVGGADTPVVTWGSFAERYMVSVDPIEKKKMFPGVKYVINRYTEADVPDTDVTTCLQVLEHQPDHEIQEFVDTLMRKTRRTMVISVPYKWPKKDVGPFDGSYRPHYQDPVDEEKMLKWFGMEPTQTTLVSGGVRQKLTRMICVYRC